MYDTLADGTAVHSNLLDASASKKLFNNKLEVEAASSIGIDSSASIDTPQRQSLALRYAVSSRVKLLGRYEIASGQSIHSRTARAGFEMQPWQGARAVASLGEQKVAEYGARSFAAFGLTQSVDVSSHLLLDATLDASKVLGGFASNKLINTDQPAASGGQLSNSAPAGPGALTENFTAVTLGATWRQKLWSVTLRGELRNGDTANRRGVTFGAIRQLGDGKVVGAGLSWTHANSTDGSMSTVFDSAIAWGNRPANSTFAFLTKLEFRADLARAATTASVFGTVAGLGNAANSSALNSTGDARSHRFIGSLSANWSPKGRRDEEFVQRSEIGLFAAVRHNFDRYDGFNLAGTTLMGGVDAHIGIGKRVELGGSATIRTSLSDHTTSFAIGPQLGFVPAKDVLIAVGYNIAGFRDRDFAEARTTNKGVFATLKMKFDSGTFGALGGFLGLGQRPVAR